MRLNILNAALFIILTMLSILDARAQKVYEGTVYLKGAPAPGIMVETMEGSFAITDFDGKFNIETNSKWLIFTYNDENEKLKVDKKSDEKINFYFDGIKPSDDKNNKGSVNLKSIEELKKEQNMDFIETWSLFYEFQKNVDYKSALPHWEHIYKKYPKASKNTYILGVEFYKDFLDKAQTTNEKEKNLDRIMEIYDQRIKYFEEKGYVLGLKGLLWLEYFMNNNDIPFEKRIEAMKTGYEWLSESIKLEGKKIAVPILITNMNISSQLFQYGELSKETVVNNYDAYRKLLDQILSSDDADITAINEAKEYIEKFLFLSGAADCEALINIYTAQYNEKSGDIDFLKEMLQRLIKAKCEESDLYITATEKLYELDQSAEAAYNMAHMFLKLDDFVKAKEYYKQAMEQESDQELLAKYYYEYGLFVYVRENALQEARDYAKKALAINPDYCEAMILIGDIYVAASRNFGEKDYDKATVFWLAVDYYNKARNSDDCVAEASQKAEDYKKYFPNKEDVFFEGGAEGQSKKIEGWINELTTIRF